MPQTKVTAVARSAAPPARRRANPHRRGAPESDGLPHIAINQPNSALPGVSGPRSVCSALPASNSDAPSPRKFSCAKRRTDNIANRAKRRPSRAPSRRGSRRRPAPAGTASSGCRRARAAPVPAARPGRARPSIPISNASHRIRGGRQIATQQGQFARQVNGCASTAGRATRRARAAQRQPAQGRRPQPPADRTS